MIKNLTFTVEGNSWVVVEQLTGDCMIEVSLAEGDNEVILSQSVDGVNFGELASKRYERGLFNTAITGVITGMYLRIRVSGGQPASGKILMP